MYWLQCEFLKIRMHFPIATRYMHNSKLVLLHGALVIFKVRTATKLWQHLTEIPLWGFTFPLYLMKTLSCIKRKWEPLYLTLIYTHIYIYIYMEQPQRFGSKRAPAHFCKLKRIPHTVQTGTVKSGSECRKGSAGRYVITEVKRRKRTK